MYLCAMDGQMIEFSMNLMCDITSMESMVAQVQVQVGSH
jgi:hypothetical protein